MPLSTACNLLRTEYYYVVNDYPPGSCMEKSRFMSFNYIALPFDYIAALEEYELCISTTIWGRESLFSEPSFEIHIRELWILLDQRQ